MVSASHDTTLKVWTFEGDCISTLRGHTALVYCCACTAATNDGSLLIASGSEDNTLRIWTPDGTCLQVSSRASWRACWADGFGRVKLHIATMVINVANQLVVLPPAADNRAPWQHMGRGLPAKRRRCDGMLRPCRTHLDPT